VPRISVVPYYKNDPGPEAVKEMVDMLAAAQLDLDASAQAPPEPRGHEATFWQVLLIIYHEAANAASITGVVAVAKEYLKRRRRAGARRPQSVRLLGPGDKEIASVVMNEDDSEPSVEADESWPKDGED
jgi:hypothetical protein